MNRGIIKNTNGGIGEKFFPVSPFLPLSDSIFSSFSHSPVLFFNKPLTCLFYHANNLRNNLVVSYIKFIFCFFIKITTSPCKFNPYLSFTGFTFCIAQLSNKCSFVSPFTPCLCNICTYRARRATNLIDHGIFFLMRKIFSWRLPWRFDKHAVPCSCLFSLPFPVSRFLRFLVFQSLRFPDSPIPRFIFSTRLRHIQPYHPILLGLVNPYHLHPG